MVNLFKLHNKNWPKTTTIMSDKDFVDRDVFKEEFPDAHLHICLFHVLRTFRREITSDKLGITQSERTLVLELLQKMAYATGEDQHCKNTGGKYPLKRWVYPTFSFPTIVADTHQCDILTTRGT